MNQFKFFVTFIFIFGILGLAFTTKAQSNQPAPIYNQDLPNTIPSQYIVALDKDKIDNPSDAINQITTNLNITPQTQFELSGLVGFSAKLDPSQLEELQFHPDVQFIEADQIVVLFKPESISAQQSRTPTLWGLDRIDQLNRPLDNVYSPLNNGAHVHLYVVDSGITLNHAEFVGRIGNGVDFVDNDTVPADCMGHGTHVAGTAGGEIYGVANEVTLHAVRIFDCFQGASIATTLSALEWVELNHVTPSVVNLSFGTQDAPSPAIDLATQSLISTGLTVVAAAGNSNSDACNISPARVPGAITVGGTTGDDRRPDLTDWWPSPGSNFGSCVDIFAPGTSIYSAFHLPWQEFAFMDGTSMAAPHVSGAAAMLLSLNPSATPLMVEQSLIDLSTKNVLKDIGNGSPNRLLFIGRPEISLFRCEPGSQIPGRFLCDLLFEEHNASRSVSWQFSPNNVSNVSISDNGGIVTAYGNCTPGTTVAVDVTITYLFGLTLTDSTSFQCHHDTGISN